MNPRPNILTPIKTLLAIVCIVLLIPAVKQFFVKNDIIAGYLFFLGLLFSFLLTPLMIKLGYRISLLDDPDEFRKKHEKATPLTGGIAIYIGFIATILFNFHFSYEMKAVLIASTLILVTGFVDDRFGLSAAFRLVVQLAAALILVYAGIRVSFIPNWLGGIYSETIITVIWLIGITNSMNFIDGMDGLAAGTSLIYSGFFALIAWLTGQDYMMFLAITVAGSCLGFLPYNFRRKEPAKIFLGDSGSTFLGFLLASFALVGEWGDNILDVAVPALIMSVLIFDMTLTTIVRIYNGEVTTFGQWIHYTGRDHFHHRLLGLGISDKQAAWLFYSVSFCFGIQAMAVLYSNIIVSVLIFLQSTIIFIILGFILVLKDNRAKPNVSNTVGKKQL